MSGTLRKSINTSNRFLQERLNRAVNFLNTPTSETVEECKEEYNQTLELLSLLEKSVDTIKAKDTEWIQYSDAIEDLQKQANEMKLYESTVSASDSYMSNIFHAEEIQVKLETRKRQIEQNIQAQTTNISDTANTQNTLPHDSYIGSMPTPATDRYQTVKPPKLVLPEFDGDPMKWRSFWGIFKANIHDRAGLSNIEKLSYLLPQLKGFAKNVIEGLLVTDENYEVAIDILTQRFDRSDDRLLMMLFGQLKRLPQANQGCSQTRKMYDQCESIFRQMIQSGEDVDSSRTLSLDYLSKFHTGVYRVLEREYQVSGHSSLGEIRLAMGRMLNKWETTTGTLDDLAVIAGSAKNSIPDNRGKEFRWKPMEGNRESKGNYDFSRREQGETQGRVQVASTLAAVGRFPTYRCAFCEGEHRAIFCERYPTAQSRLKRVKELGNCEHCTRRHVGVCKKEFRCYTCGDSKHIMAICPKANFSVKRTFRPTGNKKFQTANKAESKDEDTAMAMYNNPNLGGKKRALYQTAKVDVVNVKTNRKLNLRCVFDNLSGCSYITETAAAKLGLKSDRQDTLFVSVFGSKKRVEVPTTTVTIGLTTRDGLIHQIDVNTTAMITDSGVLPSKWPSPEKGTIEALWKSGALADDPFDPNDQLDILIGADYAWDFILGPSMRSVNDVSLVPTSFGLMLAGRLFDNGSDEKCSLALLCVSQGRQANELSLLAYENPATKTELRDVDEFWNLESIGIADCPVESDDERAMQLFEETIQFENGRYHVAWPWIPGRKELLPSNREIAQRRLNGIAKRFKDDQQLFRNYADIINQQVEKGVIERVEESTTTETVHYLSHHPVIRPDRVTTKIRVVYDASAKLKKSDLSLNECQYKGPTILPDLCQTLIRFRTFPIAITADIEKAFLQLALQPAERDVTRFLWFRDDTKADASDENVAVYRFTRVLFGVRSSPFLLAATILYHLKKEDTPFASSLAGDIYVDNIISGAMTAEEACEFHAQAKEIFRRAGMNLTQFYSNSLEFLDKIPTPDVLYLHTPIGKILGLVWDGKNDTLSPGKILRSLTEERVTKRTVLHFIASVYDPLGFFQPVMFPAKIFLQQLWVSKFEWDAGLPDEKVSEWMQLKENIVPVLKYTLNRFVGTPNEESLLIVFGDASKNGYAAAVYLRNRRNDGWETNLIVAKSRLAPIGRKQKGAKVKNQQQISIPRLELLAALIACRLTTFCRQALRLPSLKAFIFTDSMCVWHWIRTKDTNTLKRFVANRVDEIQSLHDVEFHYVNTKENPADFSTRGKSGEELIEDNMWWKGPRWLSSGIETWPMMEPTVLTDELSKEIKQEVRSQVPVAVLAAMPEEGRTPFNLDPEAFGTFDGLIKRTATCMIASKKLLWNRLSRETTMRFPRLNERFRMISDELPMTAVDCEVASLLWIKWSQQENFSKVLDDIASKSKNCLVRQLNIRIDADGILRIHGRMKNAELPPESKFPILLSSKSRVTNLIVLDKHNIVGHMGVSHTLSEVRRLYWIPHGRNFVRRVVRGCLICRKFKSMQTFSLPPMPAWPFERVSRSAVFQFAGLDYFGPVKVKVSSETRKMWGIVLTCLATRAIHLEPVYDCTTIEFLQALIRFVSRRGCPRQIICDNAGQFRLTQILTERAWKRIPTDPAILSYASSHGISWKFITELAPWQGGHYERLIGIIKSVLRTTIGRRVLSWTDFVTVLCETEAIVNSRPLTYVASDVDAQGRVVRPSDFLTVLDTGLGLSDSGFPVRDLGDAAKFVASMWKRRKRHLDRMWEVWYHEYLSILRARSQSEHHQRRNRCHRSPWVGEVVIVKDEDLPRGAWKLAKIVKLVPGSDGVVRSAKIRLGNGIILHRTLNFLIPLEIESKVNTDNTVNADNTVNVGNDSFTDHIVRQPQQAHDIGRNIVAHDIDIYGPEDVEDFFGFSQEDLSRAEQLLRQFE